MIPFPRVLIVTALALAMAVTAAATESAIDIDSAAPRELQPRSILWESKQAAFERMMTLEARPFTAARALQEDYDATYYNIEIEFYSTSKTVDGSVTMRAASLVDGLTNVFLDLHDNMAVSSVVGDGAVPLSFVHADDRLDVSLDAPLDTGAEFALTVAYGGSPPAGALEFAKHDGNNTIISSLSQPSGAREWWPCKDVPADKADSARIVFTVPDDLIVASEGNLLSFTDNGDGTHTYEWFEQYPITTYLVSIAATNYVMWTDWYHYGASDSMPITNYVYPGHIAEAQEDLNITADAIGFFASIYGEYPFPEEKYGHAIFPWGGAMEHQTCTSYGDGLIRGDHGYDHILIHELAHMWWGDWVTCATWEDIWLNEGFASYSEPLWFEGVNGFDYYKWYMAERLDYYGYFNGPIYDPDETFNRTVYDKGAWVLHMLRHIVGGRDVLLDILDVYSAPIQYGTAVTTDFIAAAESVYGASLDWFFQPWVYGENRPDYQYAWIAADAGGNWNLMLHIDQVQIDAGLFTMPIDIVVETPSGDTTLVIWNDQLSQDFFLTVDDEPTALHFDPDNWVLKAGALEVTTSVEETPQVSSLSLAASRNPFSAGTRIAYGVPEAARAVVAVYDVAGRLVARLVDRDVSPGRYEVIWDGTGDDGSRAAAGVYFCSLEAGGGVISQKLLIVR